MQTLKLLSAAALVVLPLATAGSALAQGPGPCTRPGNSAVGWEGPAMNGGQLMAGVGQCRPIAGGHHPRVHGGYAYGGPRVRGGYAYGGPGWRGSYARY